MSRVRPIFCLEGGGPRIPTRDEGLICRIHVPIDLAVVACSGRLRQRTPLGGSCLESAGSGGIWSCAPVFSFNCLVSEGAL
jgi:hypothetical protein